MGMDIAVWRARIGLFHLRHTYGKKFRLPSKRAPVKLDSKTPQEQKTPGRGKRASVLKPEWRGALLRVATVVVFISLVVAGDVEQNPGPGLSECCY